MDSLGFDVIAWLVISGILLKLVTNSNLETLIIHV